MIALPTTLQQVLFLPDPVYGLIAPYRVVESEQTYIIYTVKN